MQVFSRPRCLRRPEAREGEIMASTESKLFLAQKEVARAAREQDLREVPKRAALDRAEEVQAEGTIKPTGGAEARGQENGPTSGFTFNEDSLFDPTTKRLNRVQEQSA
jgi:hypothetical protein